MGELDNIINLCLQKGLAFAVFRPMGKSLPSIVIQKDAQANKGISGFVFHPFHPLPESPPIVIRPDVYIKGGKIPPALFKQIEILPTYPSLPQNEPYVIPREVYLQLLRETIDHIENGKVEKVIISRVEPQLKKKNAGLPRIFHALCGAYPNAYVSLIHHPISGTWMGASPEVLLKGKDNHYSTMALAGTRKLGHTGQKVIWRAKEIQEQAIVSEFVRNSLHDLGAKHIKETGPMNQQAGKMMHLKTDFAFTYKGSTIDLCNQLHPTPAVSGSPQTASIDYIHSHEPYNREYYAGYLGLMDVEGESELCVNLRCMKVFEEKYMLYVGGGVTAASKPWEEWEETCLKAETLGSIIKEGEKLRIGYSG